MSDPQDTINSQQSYQQHSQQSNECSFDSKNQDYKISKTQSANTSFNASDESFNLSSIRRIKSDNYQKNNDSSFNYKRKQNSNQRNHHDNKSSKQFGQQFGQDNQRRNNRRNNKHNNFSNSGNPPSAAPNQPYPTSQMANSIITKLSEMNNNFAVRNNMNNFQQRNVMNPNYFPLQNQPPPLPPQAISARNNQQINTQPSTLPTQQQTPSLMLLQNASYADGFQNRMSQFQNITKTNTSASGGMNMLINSSTHCSSKELDNQIIQELNSYNQEQSNLNYSSWASVLNTKEEDPLEDNCNPGTSLKSTIKTDFYQEELQLQFDDSVKKLDKGNLTHYQVDISEQDNCSPFEYLKQFRIDNSGNRSLREDYLDIMANLDLYTEKLYYAIQDKAIDHLKKNNFNPSTLLQNNNNYNNYHPNSFAAQQQQQHQMQNQRSNAKSIIKGAVQTVLEYSENRTVVPRYAREGDWLCQCGNLNFSYRNTCNKCLVMKPKYQYTKNTELYLKLDQIEKQLMNIDSTIQAPPANDQIISQQRQIILSDFIWICKCCRSINYCKTTTCVSCNMYRYIDRTKLIEIQKNSQKKLSKYAVKMQERHARNLQTQLTSVEEEAEAISSLPEIDQEGNNLVEITPIPELDYVDNILSQAEQNLFAQSEQNNYNSQSSSSSNSSDEGNSINYSAQNVISSIEDLNTTQQQICLNNSQEQILLNLSTDSDTKQSQSQNNAIKEKQCIFILDQIDDKSCDADNSSSDSLELNIQEYISKKATPQQKKKSAKQSLLKSAKSKKKSSKKKEISILQELQELNEEPIKKLKFNEEKEDPLVSDHDRTIIDEIIPEDQNEYEVEINLHTTDDSCEEYQQNSVSSQEYMFNNQLIPDLNEKSKLEFNVKYNIAEDLVNEQNEILRENLNDTQEKSGEDNDQEEKLINIDNFEKNLIKFDANTTVVQSQEQSITIEEAEEESLLMGFNEDDFFD